MHKCLILLSFILLLQACSPLDDIEPLDEITLTETFKTGSDLEAALVGVYSLLQTVDLAENNLVYLPDLQGANVTAPGQVNELIEIGNLNLSVYNIYAEQIWTQAYRGINQCNQILAVLDEVFEKDEQFSSDEARRIKGESYFLRAVLYFELIRYYAKPFSSTLDDPLGVPLVLEPILSIEDLHAPARNSVYEVYTEILNDLENAYGQMPSISVRGRSNAYVAAAYLAKVYFQMNDYEKAAEWSRLVINESDFFLSPAPAENYGENGSPEEIWSIISLSDDHDFNTRSWFYSISPISEDLWANGFEAIINAEQKAALEAEQGQAVDLRWQNVGTISEPALVSADSISLKYNDPNQADDSPMVRLAEIYLILAESLVRTEGVNSRSVELLNQIRQRAIRVIDESGTEKDTCLDLISFTEADFVDAEALIRQIIIERRVELAFEGNYFHDLMRLRQPVKGFPHNAGNLQFPIPQREMDANPNMIQNPFYE